MRVQPRRFVRTLVLAALASAAAASSATASGPGFIKDDMTTAMQQARSSGRYILVDFTGSDWCGWCIRLDKEVFSHATFKKEAGKDLVFVALDFPRGKPQSAAVKKHNAEWRKRLPVTGFPTVFLTDAEGRPFAKTGYQRGGVTNYIKHLEGFIGARRQQEQLVAGAMRVEGLDRARMLGQALAVPKIMTPEKPEILAAIAAADPEDSLGLIARHGDPAAAKKGAKAAKPEGPAKTPFQRDLEAVQGQITGGELSDAARSLRAVQQRHRPVGADLAAWTGVRMDLMIALDRPTVAIQSADRLIRNTKVPVRYRQDVARRKAEVLLSQDDGKAAIVAWDSAIEMDPTTGTAKAMAEGRNDFAARCRKASRDGSE